MSGGSLREEFRIGCREGGLDPDNGPVIAGISGGCDSMVLGHFLRESGFEVVVAHVNHGLRPEADAEEAFVRAWGVQSGFEVRTHKANEPPDSGHQEWARRIRYRFFLDLAKEARARSVLVAHHADDQLETLLINLNRGTGVSGLAGMQFKRALGSDSSISLVRPLLASTRQAVESFARQEGTCWMEDPSNAKDIYTRNAIRKELAEMQPAARNEFRAAGLALARTVRDMREHIRHRLHVIEGEQQTLLPFDELRGLSPELKNWVVLEWMDLHAPELPRRRSMAREVLSLEDSQVGRALHHGHVNIWRERLGLRITEADRKTYSRAESLPIPLAGEQTALRYGAGVLVIETMEVEAAGEPGLLDADTALIDAANVGSSLSIRHWKPGDRFQPLGMTGSKKVKSFLTDRKAPPSLRSHIPVVLSGTDVVWVAGFEIDDRFKITPATTECLRLQWTTPWKGVDAH